jgi:radical SAM protein with 4Fe4S-binding SPASM domain
MKPATEQNCLEERAKDHRGHLAAEQTAQPVDSGSSAGPVSSEECTATTPGIPPIGKSEPRAGAPSGDNQNTGEADSNMVDQEGSACDEVPSFVADPRSLGLSPQDEPAPLHEQADEDIASSVVVGPVGPQVIRRNRSIVLISRETAKWVRVNQTGYEILERCNGVNTVQEIADELAHIYDMPNDLMTALCVNIVRGGLACGYLKALDAKMHVSLWVHTTDACNMQCPFCFRGDPQPSHAHRQMTVVDWERVVDGLASFPSIRVTVSGGEPTLYPGIEPLLDMLNSKPNVQRITLLTNGTGVSHDAYNRLASKVTTLQVSLDGSRPETNDQLRGKGNFEHVVRLLDELKASGHRNVILSFTPTRLNYQDMPKMVDVAVQYGTKGLHVNRLMPAGRALGQFEDIDVPIDAYRQSVDATIRQYMIVLGIRTKYDVQERREPPLILDLASNSCSLLINPRQHSICGMGSGFVSVSAYGDVSPCASLAVPEFVYGNVQDEPVQRVYSRMATAVRRTSVRDISGCGSCEVQAMCPGGCRARAYFLTGDIAGTDPYCSREALLDSLFSIAPNRYTSDQVLRQFADELGFPDLHESRKHDRDEGASIDDGPKPTAREKAGADSSTVQVLPASQAQRSRQT